MKRIFPFAVILLAAMSAAGAEEPPRSAASAPAWMKEASGRLEKELAGKHGEEARPRLARGLKQVVEFWRSEDGDAAAFEEFVRTNFAGDSKTLDALFDRMEFALESLDGHMLEIGRDFRKQSDLDLGKIYPFDEILAGYDPSAHVTEDFFSNKLAFSVLLNFPLTTLQQRLAEGEKWSRRQWAETRLAERFSKRIPAEVNLAIGRAAGPDYSDAATGLAKQRTITKVMERIVTQTIPDSVVNNPQVDWNPFTNEARPAAEKDSDAPAPAGRKAGNAPEPDTRYATLLKAFQAVRLADPYSPTAPTMIARRFDENRQIPEARFRKMLEDVLSSPLAPRVARLVAQRLNRKIEPFDIWYAGFKPRGAYTEVELDQIVRKKYPSAEAYKKDIPNLLVKLGFSKEKAEFLAGNIVVDPARGSGHAMGAARRGDQAHLRTRVEKEGMNYKGFNIAVHEMGHNVEQTFSLNGIDHTLLAGVPNTAFTEALAFVFQARDLELLGLSKPDPKSRALTILNDFWGTFEIAGVALVDMGVWHWMYEHPDATPAQLKEATLRIARDVWNRYYAPIFQEKDVTLLAIYSHMINSFLYLPDYPLGHMIAFQIDRQVEKTGAIGPEFERMAKMGNVTPDMWMKHATGAPVGPEALLAETEKALAQVSP